MCIQPTRKSNKKTHVQVQGGVVVPDAAGRTELGPGDCFAEVAYFTEVPKAEAVRSMTVCRVLVIPRR